LELESEPIGLNADCKTVDQRSRQHTFSIRRNGTRREPKVASANSLGKSMIWSSSRQLH
jgi:hypothetical protein